jgi:hypothetical protein
MAASPGEVAQCGRYAWNEALSSLAAASVGLKHHGADGKVSYLYAIGDNAPARRRHRVIDKATRLA